MRLGLQQFVSFRLKQNKVLNNGYNKPTGKQTNKMKCSTVEPTAR